MNDESKYAEAAFRVLGERAEPKLAASLVRHGVTSADQLPSGLAAEIFREAILQTAIEAFPTAQIDALSHGLSSFQHHLFWPAFSRLKERLTSGFDAFDVAVGQDAAVVLAGFGLPVAPFDRKRPRVLAEPSRDIDVVAEMFRSWKSAYVGYSPSDIPFYLAITDCVVSMRAQAFQHSRLRELRDLLVRSECGFQLEDQSPLFRHGMILFAREPGDNVSTVFLQNANANQGSVALYAGWTVEGVRRGVPNEGFLPVPLQLVSEIINNPQVAMWIWRPVGAQVSLN